ncbi:MAG: hypothetical protein RL071_805 [Pseudomonadota bacterium]|jgi:uncharacterized protein (DUF1800 family)
MSALAAAVGIRRLGLGARPGELAALGPRPAAALRAQLDGADSAPPRPGAAARLRQYAESRADQRAAGAAKNTVPREIYEEEVLARTLQRLRSPQPFRERWVAFWSNVFTVSVSNRRVLPLAAAFEHEVVRPRVVAPFRALLRAAVRHPAMILYLDNQRSVGPRSALGRRPDERGLNENLAREVLELHTLGVDGGYTQADVRALACLLTGWSVEERPSPVGDGFVYRPEAHEPGLQQLLGHELSGRSGGLAAGEAALDLLAAHPSTARHLSRRLARHFLHPEPPEALVAELAAAFTRSDGDLGVMATVILDRPEAWAPAPDRVSAPEDWLIAAGRAIELDRALTGDPRLQKALLRGLRALGQAPWAAPSPAGWAEEGEAWSGAEGLLRRVELTEGVVARAAPIEVDPLSRARAVLGPRLQPRTAEAIASAPDPATAWALLLLAPELVRR